MHNRYVDPTSIGKAADGDKAIPNKDKIGDALVAYIDDRPFLEYFADFVAATARARLKYTASVNLRSFIGSAIDDADAFAQELVSSFEELPFEYLFSFPIEGDAFLAQFRPDQVKPVGPHLNLRRPGRNFKRRFPLLTGNDDRDEEIHREGFLYSPNHIKWVDKIYLQFELRGFVGRSHTGSIIGDCEDRIKSFVGLGIAIGLIVVRKKFRPNPHRVTTFIHRKDATGWEAFRRHTHSYLLSQLFADTEIRTRISDDYTPEQEADRIDAQLFLIGLCFDRKDHSLLRAAQWFCDSYASDSELQAFVNMNVAAEILFGESEKNDKIGVTELLRNRCAYLIGRNAKDRSEVLADFNAIYAVRSKIVHSGKSRLTDDERKLFAKLRDFCGRAILKEIELLN